MGVDYGIKVLEVVNMVKSVSTRAGGILLVISKPRRAGLCVYMKEYHVQTHLMLGLAGSSLLWY